MLALATLAGCAASPAWPPRIERLPEGLAGPIAPMKSGSLTLDEVVALARSETPSGVIIQKLRDSRTTHAISAEQAASLASRGVPEDVIAFLRYGKEGIAPKAYALVPYAYDTPYPDPYYYPYYYRPYGLLHYPRSGLFFGFGRRW